jgi:N-acetylmuramoyl-L-alanine amidase
MIDLNEIDVLAKTAYGEARGCGIAGMEHVVSTIMNRVAIGGWMGTDIISVCRKPDQFSCWDQTDPNRAKILAVTTADPWFAQAVKIAALATDGSLTDDTGGADSYYALSMRTPPKWAATAKRTFTDGWHAFYKTVGENVRNVSTHAVVVADTADALNEAELGKIDPEG